MSKPAELEKLTGIASRFGAFVAERHPFALNDAIDAWDAVTGGREPKGEAAFEALRPALRRELARRLEILRGMILTRATDNRLKAFFLGGEVRFGANAFQGKGFRSLGQEAIYGAAMRLRRGARYRSADGRWQGDVIGPMIRDLGATF